MPQPSTRCARQFGYSTIQIWAPKSVGNARNWASPIKRDTPDVNPSTYDELLVGRSSTLGSSW